MMDATLRIKNLSIALEALSRIVGTGDSYDQIEACLKTEILRFEKEQDKARQWPAKSATYDTDPYQND